MNIIAIILQKNSIGWSKELHWIELLSPLELEHIHNQGKLGEW